MMSTNFRTEVFKLCKKLQKDQISQKIGDMIHDMSVVVESKEVGEKVTAGNQQNGTVKGSHGEEYPCL